MMKNSIKYYLPVIVWALVIFSFSSISTSPVSNVYWQEFTVKKTAHVIEYGILAILLFRAFKSTKVFTIMAHIAAPIMSSLYGITDEFHQSFTPGREPKVRDIFFDTLGSFIAIWFVVKILPTIKGKMGKLIEKFEIT